MRTEAAQEYVIGAVEKLCARGFAGEIGVTVKPWDGKVINGGPLTIEFSQSAFQHEESITKVAMLVKMFVDLGGHQLQLNAVDADTLRNAQKNPERYRQLVVRIWGWSAYFVELDKEYQEHVLRRQQYGL